MKCNEASIPIHAFPICIHFGKREFFVSPWTCGMSLEPLRLPPAFHWSWNRGLVRHTFSHALNSTQLCTCPFQTLGSTPKARSPFPFWLLFFTIYWRKWWNGKLEALFLNSIYAFICLLCPVHVKLTCKGKRIFIFSLTYPLVWNCPRGWLVFLKINLFTDLYL